MLMQIKEEFGNPPKIDVLIPAIEKDLGHSPLSLTQ